MRFIPVVLLILFVEQAIGADQTGASKPSFPWGKFKKSVQSVLGRSKTEKRAPAVLLATEDNASIDAVQDSKDPVAVLTGEGDGSVPEVAINGASPVNPTDSSSDVIIPAEEKDGEPVHAERGLLIGKVDTPDDVPRADTVSSEDKEAEVATDKSSSTVDVPVDSAVPKEAGSDMDKPNILRKKHRSPSKTKKHSGGGAVKQNLTPEHAAAKRKHAQRMQRLMPEEFMPQYLVAKGTIRGNEGPNSPVMGAWRAVRQQEKKLLGQVDEPNLPLSDEQVTKWMTVHLHQLQLIARHASSEERETGLTRWAVQAKELYDGNEQEREQWFILKLKEMRPEPTSPFIAEGPGSSTDALVQGSPEATTGDVPVNEALNDVDGSAVQVTKGDESTKLSIEADGVDQNTKSEEVTSTVEGSTLGTVEKKDSTSSVGEESTDISPSSGTAEKDPTAKQRLLGRLMPEKFREKYQAAKKAILSGDSKSPNEIVRPAWLSLRKAEKSLLGVDSNRAHPALTDAQVTEWMKRHLHKLQSIAKIESLEDRAEELKSWEHVAKHLYALSPERRNDWFARMAVSGSSSRSKGDKWDTRAKKIADSGESGKDWARKDAHFREMGEIGEKKGGKYATAKLAILEGFSADQKSVWRKWRAIEMKLMDILPVDQRKKWMAAHIERMGALVKGNALVKERLEAITRWTEDVESFLSLDAEHTAWLKKHGLVAADPSNVQAQEPK